jgi:adenine phosphoribosyltransferase
VSLTTVDLKTKIRDIQNFPKEGVVFKDITPLMADADALNHTFQLLEKPYLNENVDVVVSIESRGFIFGAAIAQRIKAGFVPIRKAGKLPYKTIEQSYQLEYGSERMAIHEDALSAGQRVVLIDDVLATGGTMETAVRLVNQLGGQIVGISFVAELDFLNGRSKLGNYPIHSILNYT